MNISCETGTVIHLQWDSSSNGADPTTAISIRSKDLANVIHRCQGASECELPESNQDDADSSGSIALSFICTLVQTAGRCDILINA